MFRNRFLSSTAFFLKPDDGAGAGGGQGNDKDPKTAASEQVQENGAGEGADDDAGSDDGDAGDEEDGDGGDGAGEGDDDAGGGADEDDDPLAGLTPEQRAKVEKEIRWRDKQINRLTGKRRNAEEDVQAARTIVEKNAGKGEPLSEDEIERRANQKVAKQTYDQACDTTDSSGRTAFGRKWGDATDKLRKMGGIDLEDMAKIVLSTDHPETVLYTLGNDPDEYERVMGLPPAKRFSEFVKIGLKAPPKKDTKESKRPGEQSAPPRTINGGSRKTAAQTVDLYKDNVEDDAWYAQRNATRRKKFSNVS